MPESRYRLSPYCVAWLDPAGKAVQLVHALYGSRFEIPVELLRAITEMSCGANPQQALAGLPAQAQDVLPALLAEQILVPADDAATGAAADLFHNRLNPLELAFHRGINEGGYLPENLTGPPPAEPARVLSEAALALPLHPDPARPMDLAAALTQRRSTRAFAPDLMPRPALEQFLQLSARAFGLREVPGMGWVSVRHYPSGGARYPLEIYAVSQGVESLPDGIYYYHPFSHCLDPLPSEASGREQLTRMAQHRMDQAQLSTPAVLLLITAVFARTCWKYRGMPYQVILMEVGALYQTMYLAAAQLDLALCPIGAFPELATAELLGLDSRDEAQVGMLALGVPARDSGPLRRVTAVHEQADSVFSAGLLGPGVELRFADGSREIVPLADVVLQRDGDRITGCSLLAGRQLAALEPHAAKVLQRLLDARDRGSA